MPKLTDNLLKSLKATGTAYRRMDEGKAGFGVKVSPKGQISFIFRYKTAQGRDVPMILGYYPETSLKDARQLWTKWRAIYDTGRDPQIVFNEELAAEEAQRKHLDAQRKRDAMNGSIRQLIEVYVADLKANDKRSWSEVERALEVNVYPVIHENTKAKDITAEDIKGVLAQVIARDKLIAANRIRAYLSAAFTFGIEWDNDAKRHFEALRFGIPSNPVRDVPKPEKTEQARDRHLSSHEVRQLWQALDHTNIHPKVVRAIRLLFALGGQRIEEVLGLHIKDVDFQNHLVTLHDTKNGSTHIVPFGDIAQELLHASIEQADDSGALFGKVRGTQGIMPYATLTRSINRLCPKIGLEPFVPKDIRRTVKTLMGFAGIRKEDRDKFQNHAMTDVSSRHYDRYDYLAEKRQVMAVWDAYLNNILAGEVKTKVVPIRSTR